MHPMGHGTPVPAATQRHASHPEEHSMTRLPPITVSVTVQAAPELAWKAFTTPASITEWNFASPDWHCPRAESDLREGGAFSYRMEARDGSFGFDFGGTFLTVSPPMELRYALGPDREVVVEFTPEGRQTRVSQSFTPEATHSLEQQRAGWQSILDNYRKHVEALNSEA
jgi:uncharacterized protein YndB with AHSA1/START domain